MSSVPPRPTTVWNLTEVTGQPLEVVVFQAVAYGAWTVDGIIPSDWSDGLTGVLRGSQPWRRQTHRSTTEDNWPARDASEPGSETEPNLIVDFAAVVLENLGNAVSITDPVTADRMVAAGLGTTLDSNNFVGFPEEAATWSSLATGKLRVEDLSAR